MAQSNSAAEVRARSARAARRQERAHAPEAPPARAVGGHVPESCACAETFHRSANLLFESKNQLRILSPVIAVERRGRSNGFYFLVSFFENEKKIR